MADWVRRSSWLSVWTRAVVGPAWRRALGVWLGAAIIAAIVFGNTGMMPHDLTALALHVPGVATVLGVTWLLVFAPVARPIVRADAARYLRALPGGRGGATAIAAIALVALQLPWLALWLLGEGARGLVVVVALTPLACALAALRSRPPRTGERRWVGGRRALAAVYARALVRRAGDALVRAAGLAIAAGLVAGLVVANNHLTDRGAAVLATATMTSVLAPARIGLLGPLLDAQRSSAWLAAATGISAAARVHALAAVALAIDLGTAAIALVVTAIVFAGSASTFAWLAASGLATAAAIAVATPRALAWAEQSTSHAPRIVAGALGAAAIAIVALAALGIVAVPALAAAALLALATTRGDVG